MKEQLVLEEIQAAKSRVSEAEDDLSKLLTKMPSSLRSEKITISEVIQSAFEKLRSARDHLVTIEKLARGEDE